MRPQGGYPQEGQQPGLHGHLPGQQWQQRASPGPNGRPGAPEQQHMSLDLGQQEIAEAMAWLERHGWSGMVVDQVLIYVQRQPLQSTRRLWRKLEDTEYHQYLKEQGRGRISNLQKLKHVQNNFKGVKLCFNAYSG